MTTTAERLRSYWGERQFDRSRIVALGVQYWEIALFAALIGVALGLRFWGLGARAIHHDESLHMFYAWELAQGKGYEHVPFMHGPFQFFLSAALFKIPFIGDNDFSARLGYAIFGAALVGLPYFLRGFIGRTGAIIAAVLIAFSPSLLYFSRFARNDIYIAVFTLGMVIVVWRYLKEQKPGYLYGLAGLLMLGFVTKEVTFMTTAMFLAYLEYLLANDLVTQVRASRELKPWQVIVAYVVLVPAAWLIAAFWPLLEGPRKRWSLATLPPAAHVLIVIGTLSLPLFAPGVQRIPFLNLGDVDKYDEPSGPEPLMQLSVLFFILASAYIGLLWNWRLWSIGALIFYVPFFLLYTTFFTNGGDVWNPNGAFWHGDGGWWTGMWGSLDYWLSQQLVRRGDQPDYYYLITLPVYDFLPLIFATGGALFYAFRGRLEQKLLMLAALLLITVFSVIPEDSAGVIGKYHIHASFVIALATLLLLSMDTFTKFLIFWSLSMLFALSVAGEKMPWLTVHVALPLCILAAKVLADILSSVTDTFRKRAQAEPEAPAKRKQTKAAEEPASVAPERLLPLLYGGAFALIAAVIFQQAGPASGVGVVAWLLSAGALGVVLWTFRTASWQAAGQVAAVALLAALFVFTVRAATMAAYDEGDSDGYPQELLIYAQGSPKLDVIWHQIELVADASGLGRDLNVIVDNSTNVWPWPWYLRDQRHELSNFDTGFAPAPGSVVLVAVKNQDKMQPFLDQYEDPIPYTHMWWFPEFYKGLSVGDFLGDVFRGDLLPTWRAYFIDRTVRGASAAPDMLAFFPKEFGSVIDVPPVPGVTGPSTVLPEGSYTIIGAPGSGPGAFAQPADVAVDADGNLYVADTLNHRFQKISPDGVAVPLGESGTEEGQFANPRDQSEDFPEDGPWGIGVDPIGNVYVADTWNHRVQKFSPALEFVQQWGAGELFGPRDIAFDAAANVYVVDTGNKRVLKYQNNGNLISVHGTPGNGPGQFNEPTSLSVAPNGDIYVADYWNQRIQHFDAEFQYIDEIAVSSWGSQGIVDRGYIVALDGGRVLATDPANGRVIAFGPDGTEVASWALPTTIGTSRPVGITVDANGQAYISDGAAERIVRVSVLVLFSQPAPATP